MKYTLCGNNASIVYIDNIDILVRDSDEVLDLLMTVQYETNCSKVIFDKKSFCEEFFDLKTGIAGEIFQRIVTYGIKIAIVGDFSMYYSKSLHDFIYETNKGKDIYFVSSIDDAIDKLNKV